MHKVQITREFVRPEKSIRNEDLLASAADEASYESSRRVNIIDPSLLPFPSPASYSAMLNALEIS